MGQKRSPIWRLSRAEFAALVQRSRSFSAVFAAFGLDNVGGNYLTLRRRLEEEQVDFSHLDKRKLKLQPVRNRKLRKLVLRARAIPYVCAVCGCPPEWLGKPLTLALDHINGVRSDDRIENLRFLCPNCHAQTSTFCGRNLVRRKNCLDCGIKVGLRSSGRCRRCANRIPKHVPTKIQWPDPATLAEMVSSRPVTAVARELGVSDTAVLKRCLRLEIKTHGRGVWAKRYAEAHRGSITAVQGTLTP